MKLLVDADTGAAAGTLGGIIGRLEQPALGLQLIGRMLEDYEREEFATSGHGSWQPDTPKTEKLKNSGRVLVDTGHLMQALTRAHVDGDDVTLDASDIEYAGYVARRRNPVPPPERSTVSRWAEALGLFVTSGRSI